MIEYLLLLFLGFSPFIAFIVFGFFVIYKDREREKLVEKKKLKEAKSH